MLKIDGKSLTIDDLVNFARHLGNVSRGSQIKLGEDAKSRVRLSNQILRELIKGGAQIYGVNTGFGNNADIPILSEQLPDHQRRLIYSHSASVGEPLPEEVVRAAMISRANSLALGFSAISPITLDVLVSMIKSGITPIVPRYGSVGASGDLALLATVALSMIGEGEVFYKGKRMKSNDALKSASITLANLDYKDGLALINGCQFTTGTGAIAVYDIGNLLENAYIVAAMYLEALCSVSGAFDPFLHEARPHKGQIKAAKKIRALIQGSSLVDSDRRIQDPYALRGIPQFLGALEDSLDDTKGRLEIELNSATDNPLIDPETRRVHYGANFIGQQVGNYLAFLQISLVSSLMKNMDALIRISIDEKSSRGLPAFLAVNPGSESGLMIGQYTASSLFSRAKAISYPATVDSIPTSAGQEDPVSMAWNTALSLRETVELTTYQLAIGLLCATQAIYFRSLKKPRVDLLGRGTASAYLTARDRIEDDKLSFPYQDHHGPLSDWVTVCTKIIKSGELVERCPLTHL